MCKIICVTNRKLCADFLGRVKEITQSGAEMILREKDLSESEYEDLAAEIIKINPAVTLHTHIGAAIRTGCKKIHLPMPILREKYKELTDFNVIGASVHSPEEAAEAQSLGASYVTAGHIFATDCKKGVPPRGLDFLKNVCAAVKIPVYAIGGITPETAASAVSAGADGICVMSGLMTCENARAYISDLIK